MLLLTLLLAGMVATIIGMKSKVVPTLVGLAMVLGIVAVGTAGANVARQTGPPQVDTSTQPVLSSANDDTTALGTAFDSIAAYSATTAETITAFASEMYTQVQDAGTAAAMNLDIGMLFLIVAIVALMATRAALRRDEDFGFPTTNTFQMLATTVEDLATHLRQLFGKTGARFGTSHPFGQKGSFGPVDACDRAGTFAFG